LLPDGRLDTQPSTQLPVMAFGSFSSCAVGDIGEADGAAVVDDVRRDTVLRVTTRCFGFCGRATCLGASTRTLGSEVVAPPEGVAVCAIAVPLRPHSSSAIDKIATASLATKGDENLIALSSQMQGQPIPSQDAGYHVLMRMELPILSGVSPGPVSRTPTRRPPSDETASMLICNSQSMQTLNLSNLIATCKKLPHFANCTYRKLAFAVGNITSRA
jgi:hypothetical protein